MSTWIQRRTIIVAWAICVVGHLSIWHFGGLLSADLFRCVASALASMLSFGLCLEVARDHQRGSLLRAAWLCFAGDALFSFVRWILVSWSKLQTRGGPFPPLMALMILVALVLFCTGLALMWRSLAVSGLGFRLLKRDWTLIGVVSALAIFVFAHRIEVSNGAGGTNIDYWSALSLPLLFAAAGAGIALERFALQMGGGQLAASIHWLVIHMLLRCALNSVALISSKHELLSVLQREMVTSMPWAFALAVTIRAQVIAQAAHDMRQHWEPWSDPVLPAETLKR